MFARLVDVDMLVMNPGNRVDRDHPSLVANAQETAAANLEEADLGFRVVQHQVFDFTDLLAASIEDIVSPHVLGGIRNSQLSVAKLDKVTSLHIGHGWCPFQRFRCSSLSLTSPNPEPSWLVGRPNFDRPERVSLSERTLWGKCIAYTRIAAKSVIGRQNVPTLLAPRARPHLQPAPEGRLPQRRGRR